MLRRISPALTVLLAVLFDTAILPVFYTGHYAIMLSMIVVILIGILCGRMRGMLYGLIAGLILDFTSGTVGMKLFAFILFGFLAGFLMDTQPDLYAGGSSELSKKDHYQYILVRFIWICVLVMIYEVTMVVIQYFANAIFEWAYLRDAAIRTAACGIIALLLSPLLHAMYIGNSDPGFAGGRKTREVKDY